MPAYLIGTIRITDPGVWQTYVDAVGATFEPHGGRVLFRGAKAVRLNGDAHCDVPLNDAGDQGK